MEVFKMSAKVKLISFISAFILVLGIMIIGVLSAEQVKVNIGGSVSFNATNVYARVSGNISGAQTGNKTFSTLTYSAEETTGEESDWTNLALEFTETPDPIIITITVENLSEERQLQVSLSQTLAGSGLGMTITQDDNPYTSGAIDILAPKPTSGTSITTFKISLTVMEPNENLNNIDFSYILNLTDESLIPDPTPVSSFEFKVLSEEDKTVQLTRFIGTETDIVVPTTVSQTSDGTFTEGSEYTVTAIESEWGGSVFYGSISSVILPATLQIIGENAFSGSAITSITIPRSVTTIENGAFQNSWNLTTITFEDNNSLLTIGERAFAQCGNLTALDFEKSQLKTIGDYAFNGCNNLASITIPNSITSIGFMAFPRVGKIEYNIDENGVYYLGNETNHYLVLVDAGDFSGGEYTVKDGCKVICEDAFTSSGLTSIIIANSVINIGAYAFRLNGRLTTVTIPKNVSIIGINPFSECGSITEIIVEEENNIYHSTDNCLIETATNKLISGCKSSIIPNDGSVTTIGDAAFSYCTKLSSITIPNTISSIGTNAFSNCSLDNIFIPASVTTIGAGAFVANEPTSIIVDEANSVYHSENNCLIETSTKTLILGCGTSIIPNDGSVRIIGSGAFHSCFGLKSLIIPNTVNNINSSAFFNCTSLVSITIETTTPPTIGSGAFNLCHLLSTIYVPAESVDAYKSASGWSSYEDIITAIA